MNDDINTSTGSVQSDDNTLTLEQCEQKIKDITDLLDKTTEEKDNIDNQLKKVLADYQNLEKSLQRRSEIMLNQLKVKTAADIIEVRDDVNFAMKAAENMDLHEDVKSWMEGILSTLRKLDKALAELGIAVVEVKKGDKFDSAMHEALGVVYEGEPDTIHDPLQNAYVMGDVVVRPARVIVSKAGQAK